MTSIPSDSADAVTVPGAVASWAKLIEDHGTMKLAELLQPAIAAAEDGYPVTERVARDWARQADKLRKNKTATAIFLPNGATPRPGDVHRQPALAAALRSIASDGPTAFYEGWIARDMVDALRAAGGCHTLEDFSAYAPEYVTPIGISYRGYEVWECPPNGQGVVPLAMLKALEGFNASAWAPLSVERCHALTEIGRQAYADRDCFVGDPRTGEVPLEHLLSDERSAKLRGRVSMERRMDGLAPSPFRITAIPLFSPSLTPIATPWRSSIRSSMILGPASSAPQPGSSSTTALAASCLSPDIPMRLPDASGR